MFKFKIISENEPLVNDPFYAWLSLPENNPRKAENVKKRHIRLYLESLGFVTDQDRISEEDYKILTYIVEHWHRTFPRMQSNKFPSLFQKAKDGFYIAKYQGRYSISSELSECLKQTGLIYNLSPENYYFEIINGNLYIKYQQIIGSRFICKVLED